MTIPLRHINAIFFSGAFWLMTIALCNLARGDYVNAANCFFGAWACCAAHKPEKEKRK